MKMYNKKNFSKSIDFKKLEILIRSLFRKDEVIKTKKIIIMIYLKS